MRLILCPCFSWKLHATVINTLRTWHVDSIFSWHLWPPYFVSILFYLTSTLDKPCISYYSVRILEIWTRRILCKPIHVFHIFLPFWAALINFFQNLFIYFYEREKERASERNVMYCFFIPNAIACRTGPVHMPELEIIQPSHEWQEIECLSHFIVLREDEESQ